MKREYGKLRSWHTVAANAVVVIALCLPLLAQASGKTVTFKTGKFEFKPGNAPCTADFSVNALLDTSAQQFDAEFSTPKGRTAQCHVRFSLANLHGAGKYGKASVVNFDVGWEGTKSWDYNMMQDDCTFTFSKLDERGATGTVACTGKTPVTDAKFSVAP
jgi:hypothetical protein